MICVSVALLEHPERWQPPPSGWQPPRPLAGVGETGEEGAREEVSEESEVAQQRGGVGAVARGRDLRDGGVPLCVVGEGAEDGVVFGEEERAAALERGRGMGRGRGTVQGPDGAEVAAGAKGPGSEAARDGCVVAAEGTPVTAEGTPGTAGLRTAGDRERWRRRPAGNCAVPGFAIVRHDRRRPAAASPPRRTFARKLPSRQRGRGPTVRTVRCSSRAAKVRTRGKDEDVA